MTQAANDTIDVQLSAGRETHFKKNFSLKLQVASFVAIYGIRLVSNFDGCGGRTLIELSLYTASARNFLSAETRCLNTGVTTSAAAAVAVAG